MKRACLWVPVLGAIALTAVAAAEPGVTPPQSRDAVWRQIFARPRPPAPPSKEEAAKAALGAMLFADTRLSGDGTRACVSCHDPARAFTDGLARAKAHDGQSLQRNTPSLYNLGASVHFFADGRAASLEDQARIPMTAPNEMAGDLATIAQRLNADPKIKSALAEAFPGTDQVTDTTLMAALAAYERTLASPQTRFDQWVEGDDSALSDEERQGFTLFVGKAGCVGCHGGWRFTDDGFRDGVVMRVKDPSGSVLGSRAELQRHCIKSVRVSAPNCLPTNV